MIDAFRVPDGWETKPLGEATRLVKDKVEPAAVPDAQYVGLEHVEAHSMRLLGSGRGSDVRSAKTKFAAGDVLYGKLRPYLNKVTRPPFDGISSTDFLVFTESDDLDRSYLAQFLNQLWVANYAHHASAGVELPRVDWKSLATLPIAFPRSKEIQRAIVDQVEQVRERAAATNAHLDRASAVIGEFRQAVFAAACSGRLSADWREHEDGSQEVESVGSCARRARAEQVSKAALPPAALPSTDHSFPETWEVVSLDSITTRITSGSRDWSRYYGRGQGTFVMAQNVHPGVLDWSYRQRVDPPLTDANRARSQIQMGDLLVTIVGANTGDVAPVLDDRPEHFVCQSVALARPAIQELAAYLSIWFNSAQHGQRYLNDRAYGAGRPHLSFDQLRSAPVCLPPLLEQAEIVSRVGKLLRAADALSERVGSACRRVDGTSQAVLAKAFRGELLHNVVSGVR